MASSSNNNTGHYNNYSQYIFLSYYLKDKCLCTLPVPPEGITIPSNCGECNSISCNEYIDNCDNIQ